MSDGSLVELLRTLPQRGGRVDHEAAAQSRRPEPDRRMGGDADAARGAQLDAQIRSALLGELRLMGRPGAPGSVGRPDEAASPAGVAA